MKTKIECEFCKGEAEDTMIYSGPYAGRVVFVCRMHKRGLRPWRFAECVGFKNTGGRRNVLVLRTQLLPNSGHGLVSCRE